MGGLMDPLLEIDFEQAVEQTTEKVNAETEKNSKPDAVHMLWTVGA